MCEIEEIRHKIEHYFSLKNDIDTVLLFAKGTSHEKSDIDIAVHSRRPLEFEDFGGHADGFVASMQA